MGVISPSFEFLKATGVVRFPLELSSPQAIWRLWKQTLCCAFWVLGGKGMNPPSLSLLSERLISVWLNPAQHILVTSAAQPEWSSHTPRAQEVLGGFAHTWHLPLGTRRRLGNTRFPSACLYLLQFNQSHESSPGSTSLPLGTNTLQLAQLTPGS